jgi:ATP-dependent DNA helicase RecQ
LIDPAVSELPRAPRLALTATATPPVEQDVITALALDDPIVVRRPVDRPNLRFSVRQVGSERDRAREMLRFVTAMKTAPGIVYASRRVTTEEVAWLLRQAQITARLPRRNVA